MPFISEQVLCCFLHNLERRTCIVVHPIIRFGQIWMQISVLYSARLTRIEYLDVHIVQQQDRRVISACTASEGDVWSLLPLFLHFIRIREIHRRPQSATSSGALMSLWSNVQILGGLDRDARWQWWWNQIPRWRRSMPLCLLPGSDVVSPCQFLLTSTLQSALRRLEKNCFTAPTVG